MSSETSMYEGKYMNPSCIFHPTGIWDQDWRNPSQLQGRICHLSYRASEVRPRCWNQGMEGCVRSRPQLEGLCRHGGDLWLHRGSSEASHPTYQGSRWCSCRHGFADWDQRVRDTHWYDYLTYWGVLRSTPQVWAHLLWWQCRESGQSVLQLEEPHRTGNLHRTSWLLSMNAFFTTYIYYVGILQVCSMLIINLKIMCLSICNFIGDIQGYS